MREHEEFVVETDKAGEAPVPFWSRSLTRMRDGDEEAVEQARSCVKEIKRGREGLGLS